jgi:class 3 adenylate cyclase
LREAAPSKKMPPAMPRLQSKSFDQPDQQRKFTHGVVDVVQLGEMAVGRFRFQPGWRWSQDVAPIVGTRSCQHRHYGYTLSGSLHICMDDGSEHTLGPGQAYEIPPGHDAWVVGDEAWNSVEFASAGKFAASPDELGERTLATILFSDIVDSTPMLERMGDRAWAELLDEHNVRVRAAIDEFRGREMATLGDGFLAVFDGAARAVRAAAKMNHAVADLGLRLRVGIHTGELELVGGQARGMAVHTAARVASVAGAGEVLISATTHDLLDGSGLSFDDFGVHELKGLRGTRPLFSYRA